mgnify:CR=1 FL=1
MEFMKLSVNIDHIATLREQRGEGFPSPAAAAIIAVKAGAHGITVHLREDHRHTQPSDLRVLKKIIDRLNLEMAFTPKMIRTALSIKPFQVTLVPEKRQELTTESGLALSPIAGELKKTIPVLQKAGIAVSLFIEPGKSAVDASARAGADIVELHTGIYANAYLQGNESGIKREVMKIRKTAEYAFKKGLRVHIGHGLTIDNIKPFVRNKYIEEASIGHFLVSYASLLGLGTAVKKMKEGLK